MEWLVTILCWWVTILGMLYDHPGKHVTPGGAGFLGGIGEMTLAYLFEIPGDGPGLSLKIKKILIDAQFSPGLARRHLSN